MGYNILFEGKISFKALKEHLYTLPHQSDAIPYITSYYKERWGFCLSQNKYDQLKEREYYVKVDTKHFDGALNYAELIITGKAPKQYF